MMTALKQGGLDFGFLSSVRFATDLPLWQVFSLAVLAAITVFWLYSKETQSLRQPYRYLIPAVRSLAVVLVVLIFTQPIWHYRQTIGTLGKVIFAIDVSDSMSINDSAADPTQPNRWQNAISLLSGESNSSFDINAEGWLHALSKTHEIEIQTFSSPSDQELIWSSRQLDSDDSSFYEPLAAIEEGTGGETSISGILAPILADQLNRDSEQDDSNRLAVVLMTDGQDKNTSQAEQIADRLHRQGVSIHTVGFGGLEEPVDVGIHGVEYPNNAPSDGQLVGEINLKAIGSINQPIRVHIEANGQTVWEHELIPNHDGIHPIPFEMDLQPIVERLRVESEASIPPDSEVLDFMVSVESDLEFDTVIQNSEFSFRVTANHQEQTLLIIDGSSRWEMRYVRNLFSRDPSWNVETLLVGPGTDNERILRSDEPGGFPISREGFAQYDAIILGEIPPELWLTNDSFRLKEYVSRGGGLIVLDGRFDRVSELIQHDLQELIPVDFRENQTILRSSSQGPPSVPLDRFNSKLTSFRQTPVGKQLSVLDLADDSNQSDLLWNQLPTPEKVNQFQVNPDAEIWVEVLDQAGTPHPWMVSRLYGSGRVVYLASDQTWRWRYKFADLYHGKFWNQLITSILPATYSANNQYVAIGTDQTEYHLNESAHIRVKLQGPDGKPRGDTIVNALLTQEETIIQVVPLQLIDAARGTFEGDTGLLSDGKYEIKIQASGFDEGALNVSTPIWVENRKHEEMNALSQKEDSLRRLASRGGGEYFSEQEANSLIEKLTPLSEGRIIESDYLIWQSYPWFCLIMGLLSIEWTLRKIAGLV